MARYLFLLEKNGSVDHVTSLIGGILDSAVTLQPEVLGSIPKKGI